MSQRRFILIGLIAAGTAIGAGLLSVFEPAANAQTQVGPSAPMGRFQFSSYSGSTPDGLHHGVYIIDTATGQLWHASLGGEPQVIARKLPQ